MDTGLILYFFLLKKLGEMAKTRASYILDPSLALPPRKSLEDSSLCHLLDEPFRTRLIATSWMGLQYLYTLPTLPTTTAEEHTHSHQPCRQGLPYGANSRPDGNRGSAENQG